ncbi:unnamed protein product [Boreogadus saida]
MTTRWQHRAGGETEVTEASEEEETPVRQPPHGTAPPHGTGPPAVRWAGPGAPGTARPPPGWIAPRLRTQLTPGGEGGLLLRQCPPKELIKAGEMGPDVLGAAGARVTGGRDDSAAMNDGEYKSISRGGAPGPRGRPRRTPP